MPSVGGGGSGGGFHGGGSFGGGGGYHGGGGGGYRGGPYYRGPRFYGYYGGGLVRSIVTIILMPIIFIIIGAVMCGLYVAVAKGPATVDYDETTFRNYAFDKYAKFYGTGEDDVLFVLLTSDTPEEDGYYQIGITGDNLKSRVSGMFGDDNTVFGSAFDNGLPQDYNDSLLNAFRDALDAAESSIGYMGGDIYYSAPTTANSPRIENNASYVRLNEEYLQTALDEFKTETGLTISVCITDVDDVFTRSKGGTFLLIIGIIFLLIGAGTTVYAVRAIKKRKEAKNNSAHMNVKDDGYSDRRDF